MAKTWSWSTAQAVAAGGDARMPPRILGLVPGPVAEGTVDQRGLANPTQNRSIRPVPHETAAIASDMKKPPSKGRLLR